MYIKNDNLCIKVELTPKFITWECRECGVKNIISCRTEGFKFVENQYGEIMQCYNYGELHRVNRIEFIKNSIDKIERIDKNRKRELTWI